jgi:hypothetical protein
MFSAGFSLVALLATASGLAEAAEAAGPGTTRHNDFYWIRAVTQPSGFKPVRFITFLKLIDFHKYLQTKPQYSPGIAYMDANNKAGQFNIDRSGQFIQLVSGPNESKKLLYGNVASTKSNGGKTLAITFSEKKNTYGSFKFSGDTVQWSHPARNQKRGNFGAFYICKPSQQLLVNMGQYGDPNTKVSGCSDHTVRSLSSRGAFADTVRFITITRQRPMLKCSVI